jgi:PTS system galactitol-specific IIA component
VNEEYIQGKYGFTLSENLILFNEVVSSREEIIRKLGELLYTYGYVKDSFTAAVLDREKVFPTGLETKITGVAVPHTDTEHVNKSAIAMATLTEPVVFKAMGYPEKEISNVNIVFMLAVNDKEQVVNVLRNIIFILETEETLKKIAKAENREQMLQAVIEHLKNSKNM